LLLSIASTSFGNAFVRLDYNLTLGNRSRDTVFFELFDDRPLTRDNFLQYVNGNHYNGTLMHRLAKNFVIQGGGFYPFILNEPAPLSFSLDPGAEVDLDQNPLTPNPTVMNEYSNSPTRSNLRGTIAMA
jgi:cyclophilin family peptidyl-prolyl cis-trans isomerase